MDSSPYLKVNGLDDALLRLLKRLLRSKYDVTASRGRAIEMCGIMFQITNPRARLSRTETRGKVFSGLGEFLWYMSGSNELEHIEYYLKRYGENSDDGKTVHGAYGPRLFNADGENQIENVARLLKSKPTSRRAVVQLFSAADLREHYKDIPCTCTLQFMIRNGRMDMLVYMRSNDVYLGLPHDVFAFTMLQELMARKLNARLGSYKHMVGSLHLYDSDRQRAERYVSEGWQSSIAMPSMPPGDQWPALETVLQAEEQLRAGKPVVKYPEAPYWRDIVRLLQVFQLQRQGKPDPGAIESVKSQMTSKVYRMYIEHQREVAVRRQVKQQQELELSTGDAV